MTVRVEIISGAAAFAQLKRDWERIYSEDPHAQLFLSWTWLNAWLPLLLGPWAILAAREENAASDQFIAFWPIRIETRVDPRGVLVNVVKMAGNHAADYTGFICRPGIEHRVIPAFARKLMELSWAQLILDNIAATSAQTRLLLAHFAPNKFEVTHVNRTTDNIDLAVCPYAELPCSFDEYLAARSANTRQKLRKLLRLVDADGPYHVTLATDATIERDLDILLGFWRKRWQGVKGRHTEALVCTNRTMLMRSWQVGLLELPIVWLADRPLGGLAILMDAMKGCCLFYKAGRDEEFDGPPVGLLLHAHSIRRAIAAGFARYDFLRGNEPYKYSFTPNEQRIDCIHVKTRNGCNLHDKLHPATIGIALELATEMHRGAKFAKAERAYLQILKTSPDHAEALYRYGQLLMTTGSCSAARRVFSHLVRVRRQAPRAWLLLAQACEATGHLQQAEQAYRCLAAIAPEWPEVKNRVDGALRSADRAAQVEVV